ncbi:RHS repeat-associated core domain-containing protein [Pseudomonas wadenswilerensis]
MDRQHRLSSLLAPDARNTPLAFRAATIQHQAWTAHGHRAVAAPARYPGFNGEFEEHGGIYLLGSYRAYNPVLMRFHNPDTFSPFGKGGLNAYGYCLGDPVNHVDPTGHLPWWGMTALGLAAPALGVAGVALMSQAALGAIAVSTKVATALSAATIVIEGGALLKPEGRSRNAMAWAGLAMGVMAAAAGAAVAFKGVAPASYSRVKDRLKNVFRSRQRPDVNPVPNVDLPRRRVFAEMEWPSMELSNNRLNRRIHQATLDTNRTRMELQRAVLEGANQDRVHQLRAALESNDRALRRAVDFLMVEHRPRAGMPVPANPPDLIVDAMNVRG